MSFGMYSFEQFCRVFFFFCPNVWSSISGFSKGIQLCVDCNNIRVQSQGKTAEKQYLHKEFDVFCNTSIYGILGQFL